MLTIDFDLLGIKMQIIFAQDEAEFNAWKTTTEKMKQMELIENKKERTEMFKQGWDWEIKAALKRHRKDSIARQ